ncbi:Ldh family oxidoreductase [Siccirubricoccus sp. G192]|uniref:Ldh family oxidoreductase n=1 Tax=Siccirubricoccus sp. G192 TaxID=2849651 RepID=UPI001C2C88A3|nr:Ldh family oxidoreductase [Siccirubricoccus sp. G192]MBV1798105.1 Ldh family oxidoreductase [Siccirubricoccus sp. G192]
MANITQGALVAADSIRAQILAILRAWGMPEDTAATTAQIMVETDLLGVDSHGVSMLMSYEEMIGKGQIEVAARPRVVRDSGPTALLDGGAGLGHPVSVQGMEMAVEKALQYGVGVVGVVNSHHFGAAGAYARIASERGVIGMVTSSTRGVLMLPTRGSVPVLGTNPIAFAAPAQRNKPFVLDMATTTVAGNKVKVYHLNDKEMPAGWMMDDKGQTFTDPHLGMDTMAKRKPGGITPLGGTPDMGSHKGYGLAMLAHILGGTLVGASFSPIRNRSQKPDEPNNIGHYFMALDPKAFREEGAFEADLDDAIDVLHATPRANPDEPVLVAGEPEEAMREARLRDGVPIPTMLDRHIRDLAERCGAPYLLRPNA